MKTLIYQVYVGPRTKLYDYCTKSVKKYAERIGADYICQTEPILKIKPNPFTTGRSKEAVSRLGYLPIYEKENAFDYFNLGYDRICIIDSDIVARVDSPNIFLELDSGEDFRAVIEREMPITDIYHGKILNYSHMQYSNLTKIDWKIDQFGYEFMNMGVMLMGNDFKKYLQGQTAKEFLNRNEFRDFIDGKGTWKWSTDQTLLNAWIRSNGMKISGLDWKFNGLYGVNTRIKECHFIHFFLKDKLPNKGENIKELMKNV